MVVHAEVLGVVHGSIVVVHAKATAVVSVVLGRLIAKAARAVLARAQREVPEVIAAVSRALIPA